jgi:hypothetical protein
MHKAVNLITLSSIKDLIDNRRHKSITAFIVCFCTACTLQRTQNLMLQIFILGH